MYSSTAFCRQLFRYVHQAREQILLPSAENEISIFIQRYYMGKVNAAYWLKYTALKI